ncbi:hypothetical protein [Acidithiobacillus albertensis]|uniref:hypothetical protein n=1 Tax=Acidithiobacillus albertensis TaxID=119978 RepID=UPI001D0249C5|nr:hypothetical protein [Acidithiobacillus albertensis]
MTLVLTVVSALRRIRVPVPLWMWAGRAGSALTIAAALILAIVHNPSMRWLFVIWTISNALWLWYGWRIGSGSLVSAQVVFLVIDALGISHYWILGNALWMRMFS